MATLQRDGVEIYYEVQGEGPLLVLTHGFSSTGHLWRQQVDAWARHFQVVTWDLRGHGRSGAPSDLDDYDELACVADLEALLNELDVSEALIGGQALGGYLSLRFHVEHPRRVAGLLLLDTGPGFRNPEARAQWNREAEARAQALETYGFQALEGQEGAHGGLHRQPKGLALAARGMLMQQDDVVIRNLSRIRVPCQILVGEQDTTFRKAADYMSHKIPKAQRVVIPRAGQFANLDFPQAVNHAGKNFLRRCAGLPEDQPRRPRKPGRATG